MNTYLNSEFEVTLYRCLHVVLNSFCIRIDLEASDLDAVDFDLAAIAREIKQHHKGLLCALRIYELSSELESALKDWKGFFIPHSAETLALWWDKNRNELQEMFTISATQPYFRAEQDCAHLFHSLDGLRKRQIEYYGHRNQIKLAEVFPSRHDGYVYLFRLSSGHYKIGFSIDPQRRGREIVSGLPFTIDLVHTIWSNQIACLESEFHAKHAGKRWGKTEWFTLDQEDVDEFKAETERLYDWVEHPDRWQEILHPKPMEVHPMRVSPFAQVQKVENDITQDQPA